MTGGKDGISHVEFTPAHLLHVWFRTLCRVVDIHSHILWGMDDGAPTIEVSLEMLALAADGGTTDIVATPHSNGEFEYQPALIDERIAVLNEKMSGRIRVYRGCDLHLSFDNITEAVGNPSKFSINGKRYVLVECSDLHISGSMSKILDRLLTIDLIPIVTHPERNPILQKEPERVARWVDLGCLVQVTALSVLGGFGKRAEASAKHFFSQGLVHVIASDAHDPVHRHPRLDGAFAFVSEKYGKGIAQTLFVDNPSRILNGQFVSNERFINPPIRKWWRFWAGDQDR
jgi:protein-tyrosine phosphatase